MTSPGGQEVGRVSVRVVPDTSGFRRELERELKAIQKSVRLRIPVDLDTQGVRAQIAQLRAQLKGLGGATISPEMGEGASERLRETTLEARTLNGVMGNLSDRFKRFGRISRDSVDTLRLRTMMLGDSLKRVATQNPFTSLGQGAAAFGRSMRRASEATTNADLSFRGLRKNGTRFAKIIGGMGSILTKSIATPVTGIVKSFGALNRYGWITVAILAAIPPLLGLIGSLLAGLPSLLAAFGAGLGVIMLGFDGIKAAAEQFMTSIEGVRASVAGVFEQGLTPQFQALAGVLQEMTPQLQQVAQGMVNMTQGFTNVVTSAAGMQQIESILSNVARFFTDLQPGIESFTQNFLTMAQEGAKHLGMLSTVLNDAADNFGRMINSAIETGRFESALAGLAEVTDALLDVFNQLVDVGLTAMSEMGGPLADALRAIGDLLVAMMPALTSFGNAFLDLVTVVAESLAPVFEGLAPLFEQFFNSIAGLLGPIMEEFAPVLGEIVKTFFQLFQAISPIFPVIRQLAGVIADVLLAALRALQPVLPTISSAIADVANVISKMLKRSGPVLEDIASQLGGVLVTALETLMPFLPELIDSFLQLVEAVIPLLPPLLELTEGILPQTIQVVGNVIPAMTRMVATIVRWVTPAIKGLIAVVKKVITFFGNFLVGLSEVAGDVIDWFSGLPGLIWEKTKNAGRWLLGAGKDVVRGFLNGIYRLGGWLGDKIKSFFKSAVDGVLDFFGIRSPSRLFAGIGSDVILGFAKGVDDEGSTALRSMQGVANDLTSIGTGITSEVTASGGLTVMSDGIEEAISRGLSGWSVAVDKFGVARLVSDANRYNRVGR